MFSEKHHIIDITFVLGVAIEVVGPPTTDERQMRRTRGSRRSLSRHKESGSARSKLMLEKM